MNSNNMYVYYLYKRLDINKWRQVSSYYLTVKFHTQFEEKAIVRTGPVSLYLQIRDLDRLVFGNKGKQYPSNKGQLTLFTLCTV